MIGRSKNVLANRWVASGLLLVVAAGFGAMDMIATDRHLRAGLIRDVRLLGQSLDVAQIAALAGSPDDLATPHYRRLREQFQAVCRARPHYRCVYLLTRRRVPPGAPVPADLDELPLMYLVDSEPEESPNYGAPGRPMAPVNSADMQRYDTVAPLALGPLADGIGTWVIAGQPLVDPRHGGVLAWLCIDVDARMWRPRVAGAAIPWALVALALLVLLWFPARRADRPSIDKRRQALLALLAGLVLTAHAAHWARGVTARNRQLAFAELAEVQTRRFLERLLDLDRVTLAGFDAHLRTSTREDAAAFCAYADALVDVRGVLAWERLSEGEPAGDMRLTQQAATLDRDCLSRTAAAARTAAADAAMNAGLTSASDFFTCPARGGNTDRLFFVFRPSAAPPREKTAVGALLSVDRLLAGDGPAQSCAFRWHAADAGAGGQRQLSTRVSGWMSTAPRLSRPLLVFGKTYHLEVDPTERFLAAYPDHVTPLVALIGLLLALGAASVRWHFLARREVLERLVAQRTQDLRASEAEVKRLLDRRTREWREATAAALAAGEEASSRIGRELHDTLCQDLIGLARQADAFRYIDCTAPAAARLLEEKTAWMAAQSAAAAKRARELSYQLSLEESPARTLSESVSDNLAQLASLYDFQAEIDIDANVPDLPPATLNHLIRIVREAVVNAARHSRADKIWLTVLKLDRGVSVSIASDGVAPAAPATWREGLGLRQMRMRAALLNATLTFNHDDRRVTVDLLLPDDGDHER
jgi:signal transduction histidine kinase